MDPSDYCRKGEDTHHVAGRGHSRAPAVAAWTRTPRPMVPTSDETIFVPAGLGRPTASAPRRPERVPRIAATNS